MKWVFPENLGGRDSGFHDAGVETFKGNFERYLARELIQNSLDARFNPDIPVHIKFEALNLERSDVPDIDCLQATFNSCARYWHNDVKARKFFENAAKLGAEPRLFALKVSDFNTTGVLGGDTDRNMNWYHLVRCAGSSSKLGGEGGSFGIGKNAPFAASRLRTVLYTTYNKDGEHAFQGVSMLASHELPNGITAQPTGFLGGENGKSVRSMNCIPPRFRRQEHGLDIVVLGYTGASSWKSDLIYSVLDNFWPAIDFGDLVVTVGDQTIDQSNLAKFMDSFSGQEDFTAHYFYHAYKSPSQVFQERLSTLQGVSLYLYTGDLELPKRIAMVRKTGMIVFQKGYIRSILPFCGVFICRNEEGNRLLREMEPPRHDVWDPDHPEKGANKSVEIEYMGFIRDCIKKLVSTDDSKVVSIPDLNRFLPDDDESPEEAFKAGDSTAKTESPERAPLPEKIQGCRLDPNRKTMQPDSSKSDGNDEFTEDESDEGVEAGIGKGKNEKDGNQGSEGADKDSGNTGPASGSKGGIQSKPSVPVRYRTFAGNPDSSRYTLVVTGQAAGSPEVYLAISTIGDDQKAPADIQHARLVDGQAVPVVGPGLLGPIKLAGGRTFRFEVELAEPIRVAMEVVAHEA